MHRHPALEHVKRFVLAPVDMQRRHVAPPALQLDDRELPAALLAADGYASEVVDEPDRLGGDARSTSSFFSIEEAPGFGMLDEFNAKLRIRVLSSGRLRLPSAVPALIGEGAWLPRPRVDDAARQHLLGGGGEP